MPGSVTEAGQLYTIGHSTLPEGRFIELLEHFRIEYLLDVRSTPYSRYVPQYNKDTIENVLRGAGIQYAHMGKHFGARQENKAFYNAEGYLDFERFRESAQFKAGLNNVKKGLEKHNIALMCTEKNPIDCHRAIMVARGFELDGTQVMHILHDSTAITQEEFNQQLLNRYFPDRDQISMFQEEEKQQEDLLVLAYRKRNKKIGYRK